METKPGIQFTKEQSIGAYFGKEAAESLAPELVEKLISDFIPQIEAKLKPLVDDQRAGNGSLSSIVTNQSAIKTAIQSAATKIANEVVAQKSSLPPEIATAFVEQCIPEIVEALGTKFLAKMTSDLANVSYYAYYLSSMSNYLSNFVNNYYAVESFQTKAVAQTIGVSVRLLQTSTQLSISGPFVLRRVQAIAEFAGTTSPPTSSYPVSVKISVDNRALMTMTAYPTSTNPYRATSVPSYVAASNRNFKIEVSQASNIGTAVAVILEYTDWEGTQAAAFRAPISLEETNLDIT